MTPLRIFVSSVQKEFAAERTALRDFLRGDALMRRFFEPFLFEDLPAADRRADAVYLDEVERQTHGSVPCNPLLAEPLCVAKYIERMGTVTGDMIRL